jgi:hypothetical protein
MSGMGCQQWPRYLKPEPGPFGRKYVAILALLNFIATNCFQFDSTRIVCGIQDRASLAVLDLQRTAEAFFQLPPKRGSLLFENVKLFQDYSV